MKQENTEPTELVDNEIALENIKIQNSIATLSEEKSSEEKSSEEKSSEEKSSEPEEVKIDMATLGELVDKKSTKLAEYQKLNDELLKKSYPVGLDSDKLERLKEFYLHSAKWKYNQALGIVEVMKAVDKLILNLRTSSKTDIRFKGLTVQAICYHLSEFESVGYAAANDFLENLYKPFNEALKLVNSDANAFQKLAQDIEGLDLYIAAAQQGISVEKTPDGVISQ
jgi:hypothetical protein